MILLRLVQIMLQDRLRFLLNKFVLTNIKIQNAEHERQLHFHNTILTAHTSATSF